MNSDLGHIIIWAYWIPQGITELPHVGGAVSKYNYTHLNLLVQADRWAIRMRVFSVSQNENTFSHVHTIMRTVTT